MIGLREGFGWDLRFQKMQDEDRMTIQAGIPEHEWKCPKTLRIKY
jgi:hypothetical protein